MRLRELQDEATSEGNMYFGKRVLWLSSILVLLSACGGGGGDDSNSTPVTSFALQAGYKSRVQAGAADNFAVSGTCSGTANITTGATAAATFEGVPGFSSNQTATLNLNNCVPATAAVTGTSYFDANYTPLGGVIPNLEYTKFQTAPPALPTTVRVGDTAVFATLTVYSDSTKTTVVGQRQLSYVVEADSSTTAFVTLITRSFNNSSQLLFTQLAKYRIAENGTLTVVTIDVQYSTTSTTRLLYTKS